MPWLERKKNQPYAVAFRFRGERFKKSLRTSNAQKAEARLQQLEENLNLVKKGRMVVPEDADPAEFLLSNAQPPVNRRAPGSDRTVREPVE